MHSTITIDSLAAWLFGMAVVRRAERLVALRRAIATSHLGIDGDKTQESHILWRWGIDGNPNPPTVV